MPWGRIDDSLYDHPKVELLPVRVRNACVGLWVRAISWSNRYLTDGRIPLDRIRKLDGDRRLADALVSAGLFDVEDAGYLIHDFLDFNDSAEAVRRRRDGMRELGRTGGKRSGEARRLAKDEAPRLNGNEAPRLNSRPDPSESRPQPERDLLRGSSTAVPRTREADAAESLADHLG